MKGPPSGLPYEWLPGVPHRAVVYGVTLSEVFEHAAEAMFALTVDIAAIPPTYSRPIVAPGDTVVELLVNWLEELRYVGHREGIVWSWFVVDRVEEGGVQGSASGMPSGDAPHRSEIVTSVEVVSEGVVDVPEGLWVELEFAVGPPIVDLT